MGHAEVGEYAVEIGRADFGGVALGRLRRRALRARVDRDHALGRPEVCQLLRPEIRWQAPTRDQNQRVVRLGRAGLQVMDLNGSDRRGSLSDLEQGDCDILQHMTGIVYVNGQFVDRDQAVVSVNDRGFVFGDGVYEVTRSRDGVLLEVDRHVRRLERSLAGLDLVYSPSELVAISLRLLRDNGLARGEATVYWQVTRGAAPRTHQFPPAGTPVTVYASASPFTPLHDKGLRESALFYWLTSVGRGVISRRSTCCPMCWPSRRPWPRACTRRS